MKRQTYFKRILFSLAWLPFVTTLGCSAILSSTTVDLANNLSSAVLNNDDLEMVKAGGPAHMLMIDGMIVGDPNNRSLLRTGAWLYTAYAIGFVEDQQRAGRLTDKALGYGLRALCVQNADTCGFRKIKFKQFKKILSRLKKKDVPELYALGSSWAGWIEAHRENWDAIAEIPRVEAIMRRAIELDETYQEGGAHVYLGVFSTLLSPALGGAPEEGRKHFERALELSKGKNLMIKVSYARHYARTVLDRKLHDRLLKQVLQADPHVPGFTLLNVLAKQQARKLLESADDYF
ncbi:MAG: TRAP transporter TatT component family protein [Deltaproteobacteria bacterium]|nr:TRAP transporter TatT component family protein [Deltaproteobacteria bacterium]